MQRYNVTRPVTVTGCRVGLSKQQAFLRAGHLAPVPGETDIYDITNRVDLKPGEVVAIETDDPDILACLTPEGDDGVRGGLLIDAAREAAAAGDTLKSGAPRVSAMEKVLGFEITAEDRDWAWGQIVEGLNRADFLQEKGDHAV